MAKVGRKPKYEEYVKPRLEEVKEWVSKGATDEEVCKALGIGKSSFYEYKNKYSEFSDALKNGRTQVIAQIKAALLKSALGFYYEEEEKYIKKDKDGDKITALKKNKRYNAPNTTAANMLLKNYDKEWQDKDTLTYELRKQEVELRKALAEANNWDIDLDTKEVK